MWHCLMGTNGGPCPPAPCSALCAGDVHTHLVWTRNLTVVGDAPELLGQLVALANPLLDVVGVEAAAEAPHPPGLAADYNAPYLVTCVHLDGVQTGGDPALGAGGVLLDPARGL